MRIFLKLIFVGLCIGMVACQHAAVAQTRIALKSGESVELGKIFFISNCRSILLDAPKVEILDGPDEVSLSIREEMVLPRNYNCAKPVRGGALILTAKEIKDQSDSTLTYRVKYKTKDGERQRGGVYRVLLFP